MCCITTLDQALAALADPYCWAEYQGTQTFNGCTFHKIARKGFCATHAYTTDQLIQWCDENL